MNGVLMPLMRIHLTRTGSTNDAIRSYHDGTHIIALSTEHQEQGRGRNGKSWIGSEGRNVACSMLFPNTSVPPDLPPIAAAAVAVHDCLLRVTGMQQADIRIKYPNDILVRHDEKWRKVSGILCEQVFNGSDRRYCIVGVGINVLREVTAIAPAMYPPISLEEWCGQHFAPRKLADELVVDILNTFSSSPTRVFQRWKELLALEGKQITLRGSNATWKYTSLQDDGILQLRNISDGGTVLVLDSDSIVYDVE